MSSRVSRSPAPAYRLRPAARRGDSRRRSRVHWDRVGRVVLLLAVLAIIGLYVVPVIVRAFQAHGASQAQAASLQQLEHENARLKKQALELATPAAVQREARKRGMVAPGEVSYVIR